MNREEKITQFKQQVENSQRIVFFGGAGVSTESGIPDFRSAKGLFMQESGYEYAPEQIVSHSFFEQHPKVFFDYYFDHLVYKEAKPNQTHNFLAELEEAGKEVAVVTQNIDGLHQKAGSSTVYELHGSIWNNHCIECGAFFPLEKLEKDGEGIPRCPYDGAIVKPDVTLYGEALNETTVTQALKAISQADLFIIAGTSLSVYPAAGLVDWFNGKYFTVINQSPVRIQRKNALIFQMSLENVFKEM